MTTGEGAQPSAPGKAVSIDRRLLWVAATLILIQAVPWSWKTSGVLQMTTNWQHAPWGYSYVLQGTALGDWPIMKENLHFIQHQALFLGNRDVHLGRGFVSQRVLYGFMTRGLWFLGPVFSALALNLVFWFLAVVCAVAVVRTFTPSLFAQWSAALLTVSGQGFLYSVGEINAHVVGYASGYLLCALACAGRIWEPASSFGSQMLVALVLGLLQLAYSSPWLMLPIVLAMCLAAEVGRWRRAARPSWLAPIGRLLLLTAAMVGPGGVLAAAIRGGGGRSIVEQLVRQTGDASGLSGALATYGNVLLEGFLALGPVLAGLWIASAATALGTRHRALLWAMAASLFQLLFCSLFLVPVAGRGYVTFGISAIVVASGALTLSLWWRRGGRASRLLAAAVLAASLAYGNLPLAGYRLPAQGFFTGYLQALDAGQWQAAPIHVFGAGDARK